MRIKYKFIALTILLCISVFLFSALKTNAQTQTLSFKPFKFSFIPDNNLSFDKSDDWIMRNESLVILQDLVKSINNVNGLNFIIWGGNLTENRDKQLLDLPVFLDATSELTVPYYVILGNREADLLPDFSKQTFCAEFRRNGFSDVNQTYWAAEPTPNVLLIGLDTSISNKDTGELSQDQLLWLDNLLKNNSNKFTIVTMHHSAYIDNLPPNPDFKKENIISNSQDFINLINKYPQVKLVLSGHSYINSISKLNNAFFVSIPSTVVYPNEYKIITVYPNKFVIQNHDIAFKQIIKKSQKALLNSDFASKYGFNKQKDILNFHNASKNLQSMEFSF